MQNPHNYRIPTVISRIAVFQLNNIFLSREDFLPPKYGWIFNRRVRIDEYDQKNFDKYNRVRYNGQWVHIFRWGLIPRSYYSNEDIPEFVLLDEKPLLNSGIENRDIKKYPWLKNELMKIEIEAIRETKNKLTKEKKIKRKQSKKEANEDDFYSNC